MSESPHKTKRALLGAASVAVLVVAVLVALRVSVDRTSEDAANPYGYDVDRFRTVPAELLRYEETGRIVTTLSTLRGLALDPEGKLYVAGDSAVVVLDPLGKELRRVQTEQPPTCVAAKPNGEIYVGMRDHVEVYSPDGASQAVWTSLGEKAHVTAIAVAGNDVFVADCGARLVWRFDRTGKLLGRIGEKDKARGVPGFVIPSPHFDVALAPGGKLWVTNPGRLMVENYSRNGRRLAGWGEPSMEADGFCGCCNPTNLAVHADGTFVTSEKGLARIKTYDADGRFTGVVAGPEQFAEDVVGLDLAVDSAGRVLVLDPAERAVRIFTEKNRVKEDVTE